MDEIFILYKNIKFCQKYILQVQPNRLETNNIIKKKYI